MIKHMTSYITQRQNDDVSTAQSLCILNAGVLRNNTSQPVIKGTVLMRDEHWLSLIIPVYKKLRGRQC